jgi:hypothetical protein
MLESAKQRQTMRAKQQRLRVCAFAVVTIGLPLPVRATISLRIGESSAYS